MNLHQAIQNFVDTVPSDGSLTPMMSPEIQAFQSALIKIQTALGQDDGGVAGIFFSDDKWFHDWHNMLEREDKIKLVKLYIQYELQHLAI